MLAQLVERHWDLQGVVQDAVLQRQETRTTYAIQSDEGSFIVKVYDDDSALGLVRISEAEIDRRLSIFHFLATQDFRYAPSLLETRTGDRFVRANGTTVYILERIEGGSPPATAETWAELGQLAARLNTQEAYPFAYGIPVKGTIGELVHEAERYPFSSDMLRVASTLDVLANQPTCLIHGEINLANAVQSSDGRISLVDWDQAGTGPWALEAGYPLITSFLSEELVFDTEAATAFYGSWTAGKTMSDECWDLVFTAALLHALRHLEFGNPARRWARIRHALAHKNEILAALAAPRS
jgi:Ser/Thr protein kinase RdoA (MazF antagonist)